MTLANLSGPFSSDPPWGPAASCAAPAAGADAAPFGSAGAAVACESCAVAAGAWGSDPVEPCDWDHPVLTAHQPAASTTTTMSAGHGVRVRRCQARDGTTR